MALRALALLALTSAVAATFCENPVLLLSAGSESGDEAFVLLNSEEVTAEFPEGLTAVVFAAVGDAVEVVNVVSLTGGNCSAANGTVDSAALGGKGRAAHDRRRRPLPRVSAASENCTSCADFTAAVLSSNPHGGDTAVAIVIKGELGPEADCPEIQMLASAAGFSQALELGPGDSYASLSVLSQGSSTTVLAEEQLGPEEGVVLLTQCLDVLLSECAEGVALEGMALSLSDTAELDGDATLSVDGVDAITSATPGYDAATNNRGLNAVLLDGTTFAVKKTVVIDIFALPVMAATVALKDFITGDVAAGDVLMLACSDTCVTEDGETFGTMATELLADFGIDGLGDLEFRDSFTAMGVYGDSGFEVYRADGLGPSVVE
eukprot:CAMPEP_0198433020 /NCGR_PEP_ID=MMETSP1452-20131203/24979_1 /TAXON_ID=1181717 /ORGANISM="Synchroma pusillum, Strain CCMP3072" /LENGTH=377 /DNA_ID=CAMNT_0044153511 /DNA_START=19 /DNA_END=1149 /DNA_ORIENTATION=-